MKRSDINRRIADAQVFFDAYQWHLPKWAYWTPDQWRINRKECGELISSRLGWDLTDFGSGEFARRGLLLFTLRNQKFTAGTSGYAEKIMIVGVDQETPFHYHKMKREDIINRGGGRLCFELCSADNRGQPKDLPVLVRKDGIPLKGSPYSLVYLDPGDSITLEPGMYHRFWAVDKPVLCGEISSVNDDEHDNCFLDPVSRFPIIDEDEEPRRLLVSDYGIYC